MARSAVDLPDPAGKQPDADDLLAQLASQEIDRLLSDADLKDPLSDVAADAGSARPLAAGEADDNPIQDELDRLFSGAESDDAVRTLPHAVTEVEQAQTGSAGHDDSDDFVPEDAAADVADETPEETPGTLVGAALQSQLDDLFRELSDEVTPTAPARTAAPGPTATSDSTGTYDAQQPASLVAGSVDAPSPLATMSGDPQQDQQVRPQELVSEGSTAAASSGDADEAPVPLWLKPLVWLNAPFAGLDDQTRALIGKIAVLTLINAIAAILVVILLKRS